MAATFQPPKNDTQQVMKECIYSPKLLLNVQTREDLNRILSLVHPGRVHDCFCIIRRDAVVWCAVYASMIEHGKSSEAPVTIKNIA